MRAKDFSQVVLDVSPNKEEYLSTKAVLEQAAYAHELQFRESSAPKSLSAEYGQSLTIFHEIEGRANQVEWELEGSAEYFEGEMVYKNGVTFAELQIESVTDETCGTYVCTASSESNSIQHKTGSTGTHYLNPTTKQNRLY